jgi:hypothetical protein
MNTKIKETGVRMANTAFDWLVRINAIILPIAITALLAWGTSLQKTVAEQTTKTSLNGQSITNLIKATDSLALTVDSHIHKPGHAVNQQRLETIESTLDRIETSVNSINKKMP